MIMSRNYATMQKTIETQNKVIMTMLAMLIISLSMNISHFVTNGLSLINGIPAISHIESSTISGVESILNNSIMENNNGGSPIVPLIDNGENNDENNNTNEDEQPGIMEVISDALSKDDLSRIVSRIDVPERSDELPGVDSPDLINNEPTFPETEILGNEDITVEELRAAIEAKAPALVGIEDALLYNYETYGIKPSYQLAVFCQESAYGKSKLASVKNNISSERAYPYNGMSAYEHARSFDTKSDCVLSFGKLMAEKYDLNTVSGVASKYCPGNAEHWTWAITTFMNDFDALI